MIKKRTETAELETQNDAQVLLTVTIGNAQIGGNVVRFKDAPVLLAKGEITRLVIGNGSELVGKTLKIVTNILDVNEQTNKIVVTYFVEGCTPLVTVFNDTVGNEGDIFSLTVEFTFK